MALSVFKRLQTTTFESKWLLTDSGFEPAILLLHRSNGIKKLGQEK